MRSEVLAENRNIRTIGFKQVTIFVGSEVYSAFTGSQRYRFARTISSTLRQHPYRMRQLSPWELLMKMIKDETTIAVDEQLGLAGFLQVGQRPNNPGVYECGSWTSFQKGVGRKVMVAGARLAMARPNAQQAVALVAQSNEGAIASMLNLGAKPVDEPIESNYVEGGDGKFVSMQVFDISHL